MAVAVKRDYESPLQLLRGAKVVKICAPMVRYSKLAFRSLVRKFGCDVAFTPMIIASSFNQSQKARDSEFTTNAGDRPLIVQFAANNPKDFADAAELVKPYADGVDLNCGCPQRWAITEGYGACLIDKPHLLNDVIRQVRGRVADEDFTVSVKIRIHSDIRKTVSLCRQLEKAGVSWVTVHGRTKEEQSQPVHWDAIRLIKENLGVPVIANGDIRTMEDVTKTHEVTGVDGVMSARGILGNPALYAGYDYTPRQCVQDWVDTSLALGTPFTCFHHHLMYMMDGVLSRPEKRVFNTLSSTSAVLDYIQEHYQT